MQTVEQIKEIIKNPWKGKREKILADKKKEIAEKKEASKKEETTEEQPQ